MRWQGTWWYRWWRADRIEFREKKNTHPHLLKAQQALALQVAKGVGHPTTVSFAPPLNPQMGRAKRICYLSPMRAAKVQASLRIRAVSPEPSLLAHTSSESRGTFRQKARSVAPLNGWACAVEICHDGMLEDTNSLGGAQIIRCKNKSGMTGGKFAGVKP